MLSRTAENLFWIGRYMERAEASARLLDVGARNALLPNIGGGYRNEWESILEASGTLPAWLPIEHSHRCPMKTLARCVTRNG